MNIYYIILIFIYSEKIYCSNLVSCLNNCTISNCGTIDISTNICYGCLDKSQCNGCATTYLYNNICMSTCPQGLNSHFDVFGWKCLDNANNTTSTNLEKNTTITKYITSTYTVTPTNIDSNKLSIETEDNIFDSKMIVIIVENSIFIILIIIVIIIKVCGCINKNKNKDDIYEKRFNMKENEIRTLKNEIYELKNMKDNK